MDRAAHIHLNHFNAALSKPNNILHKIRVAARGQEENQFESSAVQMLGDQVEMRPGSPDCRLQHVRHSKPVHRALNPATIFSVSFIIHRSSMRLWFRM